MKRAGIIIILLAILVVTCSVMAVIPIAAESTSASNLWIMGDVDNDGRVTIIDVTSIQRILTGITKNPDEGMIIRGKVTGGSSLTILDATMIQRFLAGLPYEGRVNVPVDGDLNEPSFVIERVSANPGDKDVAVTVSVVNNPGISAIALDVDYDKASLQLKDFTYNETALQGASTTPYNASAKTPCLFMVNGTKNITGDFAFATLYFDVLDSAVGACPITISYDEDNVYNLDENNIAFDVISGAIITPSEKPTEPSSDTCTVTFKDYDDTVLSIQSVEKGKSAIAPATPSRDGFVFAGWSISFESVQTDLIIVALYNELGTKPSFIVDKVSAAPGQKNVEVTVALKNNPGIAAIALDVIFDKSKISLTGFTYNDSALTGSSTTPFNASATTPCIYMVNGTKNISGDFVFATLYFDVAAGSSGTIPISVVYDPDNVYNLSETNVAFDVVNGAIIVS